MSESIFVGKVKISPIGVAVATGAFCTSFVIQLDKPIEGLPNEFPVYLRSSKGSNIFLSSTMPKGSIVQVEGKIIKDKKNYWKKEVVWLKAQHIFNETINFGF